MGLLLIAVTDDMAVLDRIEEAARLDDDLLVLDGDVEAEVVTIGVELAAAMGWLLAEPCASVPPPPQAPNRRLRDIASKLRLNRRVT